MPLVGTEAILAEAMIAAIAAVDDKADRSKVFEAMAGAILAHIAANAVVVVTTGAGAPGSGNLT